MLLPLCTLHTHSNLATSIWDEAQFKSISHGLNPLSLIIHWYEHYHNFWLLKALQCICYAPILVALEVGAHLLSSLVNHSHLQGAVLTWPIFLHKIVIQFYYLYSSGIFAYLNFLTPRTRREIIEILVNGLKRLEYRGYDSAGKWPIQNLTPLRLCNTKQSWLKVITLVEWWCIAWSCGTKSMRLSNVLFLFCLMLISLGDFIKGQTYLHEWTFAKMADTWLYAPFPSIVQIFMFSKLQYVSSTNLTQEPKLIYC